MTRRVAHRARQRNLLEQEGPRSVYRRHTVQARTYVRTYERNMRQSQPTVAFFVRILQRGMKILRSQSLRLYVLQILSSASIPVHVLVCTDPSFSFSTREESELRD
eukprot:COSAG01_NODE_253_length_20220_cov_22.308196_6_plen_106_part_00